MAGWDLHTQENLRIMHMRITLITAALALGTGAVAAQDVVSLDDWNERLAGYENGWSADQVIRLDVRNAEGESIGEVENIVIGPDGNVAGLILEVGGFLDIGDTHFMVPWDQVAITGGMGKIEYVTVPVADDNWDQFDLSASSGDVETGPRSFRATELIGDYTSLTDNRGYGIVNDLVFDADGALEAVVVNRSGSSGGGYQAYPYYGYDYGFDPGRDYYDLPYADDDLGALEPYDYDGLYGGV